MFPSHWNIDLIYIGNYSINQQTSLRRLNKVKDLIVFLPETKDNSKQMIYEYKKSTNSNEITIKFL